MTNDNHYVRRVRAEVRVWESDMLKPPGWFQQTSASLSKTINNKIPERVHEIITNAVKGMVHTALFGAEYLPNKPVSKGLSIEQMDALALACVNKYQKAASAEGAVTGFGGLIMGAVDLPAFLAIKMKMLFEMAHIYGRDTAWREEKLYILHLFQLVFSQPSHRKKVLSQMKNWEAAMHDAGHKDALKQLDWRKLQQEYREYIDFRKMLQLLPGIGAAVGAWANYTLTEELGKGAMNCYRRRELKLY